MLITAALLLSSSHKVSHFHDFFATFEKYTKTQNHNVSRFPTSICMDVDTGFFPFEWCECVCFSTFRSFFFILENENNWEWCVFVCLFRPFCAQFYRQHFILLLFYLRFSPFCSVIFQSIPRWRSTYILVFTLIFHILKWKFSNIWLGWVALDKKREKSFFQTFTVKLVETKSICKQWTISNHAQIL